jgi:hypothetical protein
MPASATALPGSFVPPPAQAIIERFGLVEQANPNPAARPGERAVHTAAARLWVGPAAGVGDGYGWMQEIAPLGWRPNTTFGDWPAVVECLRVHDPKDDPAESGRWFVYLRLTYLEGGVYLAFYSASRAARDDAWQSES